ncbi:holin [Nonomuraea rubra]
MRGRIWTGTFWKDTSERVIGAASVSALSLLSADGLGLLAVDWPAVGGVAGLAALVSLLKSIVAGTIGDPATGGFTDTR